MEPRTLGRYELLAELGKGAMGVVYRANDPLLDRLVAIKTVNMSLDPQEMAEYDERFYQEAKAAGSLNHPNIVTIYDIGKSGNVAYMAMEFLQGEELRSLLAAGKPLTGSAQEASAAVGEMRGGKDWNDTDKIIFAVGVAGATIVGAIIVFA